MSVAAAAAAAADAPSRRGSKESEEPSSPKLEKMPPVRGKHVDFNVSGGGSSDKRKKAPAKTELPMQPPLVTPPAKPMPRSKTSECLQEAPAIGRSKSAAGGEMRRRSLPETGASGVGTASPSRAPGVSPSGKGFQRSNSGASVAISDADTITDDGSSLDVGEGFPMEVDLPAFFPDVVPQVTAIASELLGYLRPEPPVVMRIGAGAVLVRWVMPAEQTTYGGLTCHVRVRRTGSGQNGWQMVDLDSGRLGNSSDHRHSWKYRALVVHPGVRILGFCVEEGKKSALPHFGKIVSYHPGYTVIDFDPAPNVRGATTKRQRVPQDWIVLAATTPHMKDVMWELLEKQRNFSDQGGSRHAKGLWKVARRDVYERIVRVNRHCTILWSHWLLTPEPDKRIAAECVVKAASKTSEQPPKPPPSASRLSISMRGGAIPAELANAVAQTSTETVSTWWPVFINPDRTGAGDNEDLAEGGWKPRSSGLLTLPASALHRMDSSTIVFGDAPTDLVSCRSIEVLLEPWPREQVIPRHWIFTGDEVPDAPRAAKNACIGQQVLSHYHRAPHKSPLYVDEAGRLRPPRPPRVPGDITLLAGDLHLARVSSPNLDAAQPSYLDGIFRSERALRCTIRRELICPAEVLVHVHCHGVAKSLEVPLLEIYDVKGSTKWKLYEWLIVDEDGTFCVYARSEPPSALNPTERKMRKLEAGRTVTFFAPGRGPSSQEPQLLRGKVTRLLLHATHYEVSFQEAVQEHEQISMHSLAAYLEDQGPKRLQQPEVVVHNIPIDFDSLEVAVGFASSPDTDTVLWSEPCAPCPMPMHKSIKLAPLGPALWADGVSRAEVRWLLPPRVACNCFCVRLRVLGERAWCMVDAQGRVREAESSFAWRSRLVPLRSGLWVSAFGDYDGRKASTPGPAKVKEVLDSGTVLVQFERGSPELLVGSSVSLNSTLTQSAMVQAMPQMVPVDWVEAVWVGNGYSFFKGSPITSCKQEQRVTFRPIADGSHRYSVFVDGDDAALPGVTVDAKWLRDARLFSTTSQAGSTITTMMQLGVLHVHGLRAEATYEVAVQGLTAQGWTPWSETRQLEMPRIQYNQLELVEENTSHVFYRAPLLPQAFYKEYEKCWQTLEEALSATPKRFHRLKELAGGSQPVASSYYDYDQRLSRWLVDLEGPIRDRAPEAVTVLTLQDLASRRADFNYRDQATGRTPLTYAAEYGWSVKVGVIETLLELRADVDSMNDSRCTALAIAASGGHHRIVETLLRHRADVTITSLQGETALLAARPVENMSDTEIRGLQISRSLLKKDRVPWEEFHQQVLAATTPVPIAKVFLQLAFQGQKDLVFQSDKDGSKRISKYDRLRLREQILEAGETNAEEEERRAHFCGHTLLVSQLRMAGLQTEKNTECAVFARYLLASGVMRWCYQEAHDVAKELLAHFERLLVKKRSHLRILRTLTEKGEMFVGLAAKQGRAMFLGRPLHQWHAHGDLPWLTAKNVVGAFEALTLTRAVQDMGDFCTWVGELSAAISASDHISGRTQLGAWDLRLPPLFWGDVYSKFILGEAARAAPIFHDIARKLVARVGGSAIYKDAPNKGYGRLVKKQLEYASFGLLVLHAALNLMPGVFLKAVRADLGHGYEDVDHQPDEESEGAGAVLIIGSVASETHLRDTIAAVTALATPSPEGEQPILLVVLGREALLNEDGCAQLAKAGADEVEVLDGPLEVPPVLASLRKGLATARSKRRWQTAPGIGRGNVSGSLATTSGEIPGSPSPMGSIAKVSSEKAQLLFEILKGRTLNSDDLYCAGGLLDLVRGSITCNTEEEVKKVYEAAISLTVENDMAEVVRVKNGFRTPAVGGYCDLKLFVMVVHHHERVHHICELQVHMKDFLECKRFTHMPYVIDRGDYDPV